MEKSFLPSVLGPSWMIKRNSKSIESANWHIGHNNFPVNDGMSILPVLEEVDYPVTYQYKDGSLESTLRFQPKKLINEEFPFKKSIPCFLPFDTEESELTFFNHNAENFNDNKLDYFSDGIFSYLVYAEKNDGKSQIIMSKIVNNGNISVNYCFKDKKVIAEYQDICQLNVKYLSHEGNILIRSPEKISLHFTCLNSKSSIKLSKTKYSSLHPLMRGHISVVDSCSSVHFYCMENRKLLWNGTFGDHSSDDKYASVFECHFTNHPSQLYVVNNRDVWHADIRMPSNKIKNLFSIGSMKNIIHHNEEVILSVKGVPVLPYFYTICNQSVILMDNRFCKEPILTWSHMMRGKPKFSQFYNEHDDVKGLILADSLRGSFTIIPSIYSNFDGDIPSASTLSAPKHFNILKDTLSYAHLNNRWHCQNVLQTVKQPLVGMAIASLPKNSQSLLCFQNDAGLLFYQLIEVADSKSKEPLLKSEIHKLCDTEISGDFRKSPTAIAITSILKKYEDKVRFSRQHHNFKKVIEGIPTGHMLKKKSFKRTLYLSGFDSREIPVWDIRKASLISNKIGNKWSQILKYETDSTTLGKRKNKSEKLVTDCLHKKYANINTNKLATFSDSLSKKLLNPWIKFEMEYLATTHEKKYGFSFKRHPPKTGKSTPFNFSLPYVDLNFQDYVLNVKSNLEDIDNPETNNDVTSIEPVLPTNAMNNCTTIKKEFKKPRRSAVQGF